MSEELPPGWAWARLSDIATWSSGGTPRRSESKYYGGSIPWAVIGDLDDRTVTSCRGSITPQGLAASNCKLLEPGTVLVAMYGSIGKLGIAGITMSTNQAIACAVPSIDRLYLFYYLLSQRQSFQRAGKGATQKNISQTILRSWPIPVAPLDEQKRIIDAIEEHFSRLDAADATLRTARSRCQALIKSVIIGAMPNETPAGWQHKRVVDAGHTGLGRQRSPKYHRGSNMRPYLRVANVFEDRIDGTDVKQMHFDENDFEKYRLRDGDVLLNEGQSPELLGRPAIYRGEPPDVAFTNSLIRFVPRPGVTSEWALLVFRRHMHSGRFKQESRITTNIAHLALGRFRTVEFPIPPLEVQERIVTASRDALDAVDRQVAQIDRAIATLGSLRRSVLAAAFSGRLVPQDPDDEPAPVLLERIAASRTPRATRRTRRR